MLNKDDEKNNIMAPASVTMTHENEKAAANGYIYLGYKSRALIRVLFPFTYGG